jgi:glutathione S-transferase
MIILLVLFVIAVGWFIWEKAHRKSYALSPGLHSEITIPHTKDFELYHNALSLCSMKSRVCMAELQIPYESHHIDLIETGCYQTISRAFLTVNPAGTVPVLVHKGHPIYESHEQIRYAAAHAPAGSPSLVPTDQALRDEMETWIDRSSLTDDPINHGDDSAGNAIPPLTFPLFATMMERIPLWKVFEGLLFHGDRKRPVLFFALKVLGIERMDHIKPAGTYIRRSLKQLNRHLDALETQLDKRGGPWILGPFFSLADVSWLVIFERLAQTDYLNFFVGNGQRPACTDYWQRLRSRPSYREAIEGYPHPLIAYGTRRIKVAKAQNPSLTAFLEGTNTN